MQGLNNIASIYDLNIVRNISLLDLEGLNSLKNSDRINIAGNDSLVNLVGLNSLDSVDNFNIYDNPLLINLVGLTSLLKVNQRFTIERNISLINFTGLSSLKEVYIFEILSNSSNTNLIGLSSLKTVLFFEISDNFSLINLIGLDSLINVDNFYILDNSSLISFDGLNSLTEITGWFSIERNPLLVDLNGLNNLTAVKNLNIRYNNNLVNLTGLGNLQKIEGNLDITGNNSLINFIGLYRLTISGTTWIEDNPSLINFNGFESLIKTQGMYIENNSSLVSFSGLNNVDSVFGGIRIENNSSLIDLNGLDGFKFISYLTINSNSSLINLNGLDNLSLVSNLSVYNNNALYDLSGLNSLNYIYDLYVFNNASLVSLNGLNGLTYVHQSIDIENNPSLIDINALSPLLQIRGLILKNNIILKCCLIVSKIVANNPSIYTDIQNNDVGCNSLSEILAQDTLGCCDMSYTYNRDICYGQNVIVGTQTYTISGIYNDTLISSLGCDSIVITKLTVSLPSQLSISAFICDGQQYTLPNGRNVSLSGIYKDTLQTPAGCDSIITTTLTVHPNSVSSKTISICNGQNYTLYNGIVVNTSGVYTDTLLNSFSCDSLVTITLNVVNALQSTVESSLCKGKTYTLPKGKIVSVAGIYKDTLQSSFGCDSIITTNLTITNPVPNNVNAAVCDGQKYTLPNGKIVIAAGIYTDTIKKTNTCDSVVITNLSVFPNTFTVSLNTTDTIDAGNAIELKPVYSNQTAVSWNWSPNTTLSCSNCENPMALPNQTVQYLLNATSPDGCEDTAVTTVAVRQVYVYMPTAFSPNNDGVNDELKVFAINPKIFMLKIYNRYGELVFQSNDINTKWNGTYKGVNCEADTYGFILDVTQQNGKQTHQQGFVLLVR